MPTVTWNYDGAAVLVVSATGLVVGDWYNFVCEQGIGAIVQADGSGDASFTFTDIIDPGGAADDPGSVVHTFGAHVRHVTDNVGSLDIDYVACNVFLYGTPTTLGAPLATIWTFDGSTALSVDYPSITGLVYHLRYSEFFTGLEVGGSAGPQTGDGSVQTLSVILADPADPIAGLAELDVADPASPFPTEDHVASNRLFAGGSTVLELGNPVAGPAGPIVQRGVCLAFDAASGDDTPVWTSLYGIDGLRVQEWDIDRGRAYELDKTQAGTVTCRVFDYKGVLDATNAFSAYAGKINPLMQIAVFLTNPITGDEDYLFRGKVENIETVMDTSMKFMIHTITGVDGFDDLANAEVIPDGTTGNATYATGAVNTRIGAALTDGQWSAGRRIVFSGNVDVQQTVYAPRDQILSVVHDGADAEFPGVANCYIDKRGNFVFHGRLARFNPTDPSYADFINSWKAGDGTHADADATIVPITSMEFDRSKAHVYNTVLSTPQNIADADIAGQISTDAPSVTAYGVRTLSFENLVTADGEHDGLNANEETKLFSDYYVNNYKTPRTRVNKLGFRIPRDSSPNLAAWWAFVCGFDISDVVLLTTTHIGGGGFNENFFVEGVHIHAVPLKDAYPELDVDVDLSPAAYYSDASGLV